MIFQDIRKALGDRGLRWLHASVLVYFAVLPFNAFGFTVPGTAHVVKYTEVALLAVLVTGIISYFRGALRIQRAWWLYAFLALNAVAQFLSIFFAPRPVDTAAVAIAVASYSVLVFILVNAIQSEHLVRGVLIVMGIFTTALVLYAIIAYLLVGREFRFGQTGSFPLGIAIPHYFAYALLMYGCGLMFMLFSTRAKWTRRGVLLVISALWIFSILLTASKVAQVATLVFLPLIFVTTLPQWKRSLSLIVMFVLIFAYLFFQDTSDQRMFESAPRSDERVSVLRRRWFNDNLSDSVFARKRGWAIGWLIGNAHPLTGIGAGQTPQYYAEYVKEISRRAAEPRMSSIRTFFFTDETPNLRPADRGIFNIFLNAWAETGIFGLLAILGLLTVVIGRGVRSWWQQRFNHQCAHALRFLLPSLFALLVMHQALYLWVHPWFWSLIALTYAAVSVRCAHCAQMRKPSSVRMISSRSVVPSVTVRVDRAYRSMVRWCTTKASYLMHRVSWLRDLRALLTTRGTSWLHLSILLYFAALPFNAYGVKLFRYTVKYTEVALLAVVVCWMWAYWKKYVSLKRAPWLYFFLLLNVAAQFLSVVNAPWPVDSNDIAIALSRYSLVVFILVNSIRSERLVRAILGVMGVVAFIVVLHSFALFVSQGGIFQTRHQPTMLGNRIGNYLSYFLIMNGVGLVFLLFSEKWKWIRAFLGITVVLWMYTITINGVRSAQLGLWILLSVLLLTLNRWRARTAVFSMMVVSVVLFAFQLHFVPVVNYVRAAQYSTTQHMRVAFGLAPSAVPPPAPVPVPPPAPVPVPPPAPVPVPPKRRFPLPESLQLGRVSTENKVAVKWSGEDTSSEELRARGVVAGWYMGRAFPLTGLGAGQAGYYFDYFSEVVREAVRNNSTYLAWLPTRVRNPLVSTAKWTSHESGVSSIFLVALADTGFLGLFALLGLFVMIILRGFRVLWMTKRFEAQTTLRFLLPMFFALTFMHQAVLLFVHPWIWSMMALTYVAAEFGVSGTVPRDASREIPTQSNRDTGILV